MLDKGHQPVWVSGRCRQAEMMLVAAATFFVCLQSWQEGGRRCKTHILFSLLSYSAVVGYHSLVQIPHPPYWSPYFLYLEQQIQKQFCFTFHTNLFLIRYNNVVFCPTLWPPALAVWGWLPPKYGVVGKRVCMQKTEKEWRPFEVLVIALRWW